MTTREACSRFRFDGTLKSCERYGNGHINDTYLAVCEQDGRKNRYILQRIHASIFKDPDGLMRNIQKVTAFLSEKIGRMGGDAKRETMNLIPTVSGGVYTREENGDIWRAYLFIENATCFERVEKPEDFYQSAYSFGRFQNLLSDFDASDLTETIADFHNTPVRYKRFLEIVAKDPCERAKEVEKEIAFCMDRAADMDVCESMKKSGELP